MEIIADKPRLIQYESVQNDKILLKTYMSVRLMYPILGYFICEHKIQQKMLYLKQQQKSVLNTPCITSPLSQNKSI